MNPATHSAVFLSLSALAEPTIGIILTATGSLCQKISGLIAVAINPDKD